MTVKNIPFIVETWFPARAIVEVEKLCCLCVPRVLFVETQCSDEKRTDMLFIKLMEYE
jgi:hypothetical protein